MKSTHMEIFDANSFITEQLHKNNKIAGLYVDLSKIFDTVDHSLLLDILVKYVGDLIE